MGSSHMIKAGPIKLVPHTTPAASCVTSPVSSPTPKEEKHEILLASTQLTLHHQTQIFCISWPSSWLLLLQRCDADCQIRYL